MRVASWPICALLVLASARVAALPALYAAGEVRCAVRLADGSIVASGYFSAVDEAPRAGIARITPQGQLDPDWIPNIPGAFAAQIVALAASPDGAQVYAATATQLVALHGGGSGAKIAGFADVNVSGSVDGGNAGIRALAVDASGRVYVGGAFAYVDGQSRNALARVDANGALDGAWVAATNSTVAAIAIDDASGFAYIGGAFVTVNGGVHFRLARLQVGDASVDAGWNPQVASTSDGVHRLALSPAADRVVLAGNFSAVNGAPRTGIARVLAADGSADAWAPAVAGGSIGAIVAASDYVYLGGDYGCCGAVQLARAAAAGSGTVDPAWAPALDGPVAALLADAPAAVVAFGRFAAVGETPALAVAALSPAGAPATRRPDFELEGAAVASADAGGGALLLGGDFEKVDASYRRGLFRLAADGSFDPGFDPPRFSGGAPLGSRVHALAVDTAGGLAYVGGTFARVGAAAQGSVARLDAATGAFDPAWLPQIGNGPAGASVDALAIDGAAIYVGGRFAQVDGVARANLARLDAAGALDGNAAVANGAVTRIAAGADGIYVAGAFTSPRLRLARLDRADGSLDTAWNPAFGWVTTWSDVDDVAAVGDALLVATQAAVPFLGGTVSVGEIVIIDASGNAQPLARFNQPVSSLAVASDGGSVHAAGTFQTLYALDDFFAQTARPAGLAQISLRAGTRGAIEPWSPVVAAVSGLPRLAAFGAGGAGVLAGAWRGDYTPARTGLDLLTLPPGEYLLRDGFESGTGP